MILKMWMTLVNSNSKGASVLDVPTVDDPTIAHVPTVDVDGV